MKATDELKKEHEGIQLMLRVMESVEEKFKSGEQVDIEHLTGILEFLSIFADQCHHGKEEEFLFPALEDAGVPREGGPIGVMLSEHQHGRELITQLKNAVADYKSGDTTNASRIEFIIKEYVALLSQHITKENTVLFPMADTKFDAKKDKELFEAFEQLERERIGVGKHEEFHNLLKKLEKIYLL